MTSASLPIAQDTEINSGLIVQGTQIIPDCSVLRSIPVSSVDTSHSGSQALDAQVAACKELMPPLTAPMEQQTLPPSL